MLPAKSTEGKNPALIPHFRFRAESSLAIPEPVIQEVPPSWRGKKLTLEIKASNSTHYAFSAGPAGHPSQKQTIGYGEASLVSWGFTGTSIIFQQITSKLFC